MTELGTLSVKLDADTAAFEKGMQDAENSMKDMEKGIQAIGVAATAVFAVSAVGIGKFISEASDANEQMNVIETSFGKLTPVAEAWAKSFGKAAGRSKLDMLAMAGATQAMLVPMVGSQEAAAGMSTKIAELAVDIGSFNNVADEEALIALQAGLIGSAEPMRRFGVVMSVATLEAFALSKGIKGNFKDMSEASKVALRYQFIMEKTALQQGDAAKTAASFANMVKRIQGQFKDLSAAMGQALLPIAEKVLSVFSSVLDIFQGMSPEAKRFTAIAIAVAGAIAGIVAAMSGLALVLPSLIAGFSVLGTVMTGAILPAVPVILAIGAAIGGVILAVGALENAFKDMGGIKVVVKGVAAEIVNSFGNAFDKIVGAADKAITFMQEKFVMLASFISGASPELAFETLKEVRKGGGLIAPDIKKFIADIDKGAGEASGALKDVAKNIWGDLKAAASSGIDVFKDVFAGLADSLGLSTDTLKTQLAGTVAAFDDLSEDLIKAGGKRKPFEKEKEFREIIPIEKAVSKGLGNVASALPIFGQAIGKSIDALRQLSPSFDKAMEGLEVAFIKLAAAFEPLFEIAAGLIGAFADFISGMGEGLSSLFGTLDKSASDIDKFTDALGDAGQRLKDFAERGKELRVGEDADTLRELEFAKGMAAAAQAELDKALAAGRSGEKWRKTLEFWNDALRGAMDQLGLFIDTLSGGSIALGVLEGVADDIKDNFEGIISAVDFKTLAELLNLEESMLAELFESMGITIDGFDAMGDSLEKVNEELLNVPTGFKTFLRRFESIQDPGAAGDGGDPLSLTDVGRGAGAESGGAPAITQQFFFENINVGDPVEFLEVVQHEAETRNQQKTGSIVGGGSFSAIPAGAFGSG